MNNTKIYPYPLEYAKETGGLEAYWGSAKANREYAAAIDQAIVVVLPITYALFCHAQLDSKLYLV